MGRRDGKGTTGDESSVASSGSFAAPRCPRRAFSGPLRTFYFPTCSNHLKEVAGCLGRSWTDTDASGIESVVWCTNWEKVGDACWKARLIQYNLEDCDSLGRICAFPS